MKDNKQLLISSIIISISIIIGSVLISNSIMKVNEDSNVSQSSYSLANIKGLMKEEETAEYLNMSQEMFNRLLISQESHKSKTQGYITYSFIPFVKIDNVKYFNREQLDKWIEYTSINQVEIDTYSK